MNESVDLALGFSAIPEEVDDSEMLHRRIHPTFVRPDGSVSSQAFRDERMSVDRASFRTVQESLHCWATHGLVALLAAFARNLEQEVLADKELLNPAHALVIGRKNKTAAHKLARAASWVAPVGGDL